MRKSTLIKAVVIITLCTIIGIVDYDKFIASIPSNGDNEKVIIAHAQENETDANWTDKDNYDYFAFVFYSEAKKKHDGELQNNYRASAASQEDIIKNNLFTTTNVAVQDIYLWESDLDFTPKFGQMVIIKYEKGNYDNIVDLKLVNK